MIKDILTAIIGGLLGWGGVKIENWIKEKRSTSLFFDFDEQILTSTYDQPITIIKTIIDGQTYPSAWFDSEGAHCYYNNIPAFAELSAVQEIHNSLIIEYVYKRIRKKVIFNKPQN